MTLNAEQDTIERVARRVGLHVATQSVNGTRRYRFFTEPRGFDQGGELFTGKGANHAAAWLAGYVQGHEAGKQEAR